MKELKITVPGTPISVNHYKGHGKGRWFVKQEALRFKASIAAIAAGRRLEYDSKTRFGIMVKIFLGKGQRGDVDNFPKCVLDGIRDARIVISDAKFIDMHVRLRRDPSNPRTEIHVVTADPAIEAKCYLYDDQFI